MTQSTTKTLVAEAINEIRTLLGGADPSRAQLQQIAQVLERLAARGDLFSLEEYPLPQAEEERSTRYLLHVDSDQSHGLYLIAQKPGRSSVPHNHKTWAVIASVQGQEINRVYRRLDDGSDPGVGRLEIAQEVVVQPGTVVTYLSEDIHSIHVEGDQPTLHFHLYGRALETLQEREAFDLATHRVTRYNQTQWVPSVVR